MKYNLILAISLFLLVSCYKNDNENYKTLGVDLSIKDKVSIFDLFEKVELIPLETSRNSLINYISKLLYFKGHYYIWFYYHFRG